MPAVSATIKLYNGMSPVLNSMNKALTAVIDSFEKMQGLSGQAMDTSAIVEARRELDKAQNAMNNFGREAEESTDRAEAGFSRFQRSIIVANQALSLVRNTLGRLGVFDLSGAFSRMDTMSQFSRKMAILTGDANAAAEALEQLKVITKGTAYGLDVAAKATQNFVTRGLTLGQATTQVQAWADAVAFYGKGTNEELETVMDALGKMLTKGKIDMEQMNRLTDVGINAVGIYAQATGRAAADVQSDLSYGKISAQQFIGTVTEAMETGANGVLSVAGAAKEAGGTWAATMDNMRAAMTRGWVNVMTSIDNALAAAELPSMMDMVKNFGVKVESILTKVGAFIEAHSSQIKAIAGFIKDWGPVLLKVGGAMLAIAAGAKLASAAISGVSSIISLLTNPIGAVVIGIVAVISILQVVTKKVNEIRGTSITTLGLITGALTVAGAFILNKIIGLLNTIIQLIWNQVTPFMGIIEWVLNACQGGFDSFGDAVKNLLGQIISAFLDLGKVASNVIDMIFGTDYTKGLTNLQNKVLSWGKNGNAITISREAPQIKTISYSDAFNKGASVGDAGWNKLKKSLGFGGSSSSTSGSTASTAADYSLGSMDSIANATDAIASNTAAISDTVTASNEELKLLREMSERQYVNALTSSQVTIDMSNMINNLYSDADIDAFLRDVQDYVLTGAEGVHV